MDKKTSLCENGCNVAGSDPMDICNRGARQGRPGKVRGSIGATGTATATGLVVFMVLLAVPGCKSDQPVARDTIRQAVQRAQAATKSHEYRRAKTILEDAIAGVPAGVPQREEVIRPAVDELQRIVPLAALEDIRLLLTRGDYTDAKKLGEEAVAKYFDTSIAKDLPDLLAAAERDLKKDLHEKEKEQAAEDARRKAENDLRDRQFEKHRAEGMEAYGRNDYLAARLSFGKALQKRDDERVRTLYDDCVERTTIFPIAVADFEIIGDVDIKDAGKVVAERLKTKFSEFPNRFRVVERAQLAKILDEVDLTIAQVVQNSALLKGKKIRGVRYLVLGSINKFGDLAISARLVDVVLNPGIHKRSAEVTAEDEKGLNARLGELASMLAGDYKGVDRWGVMCSKGPEQHKKVNCTNKTDKDLLVSLEHHPGIKQTVRLAPGKSYTFKGVLVGPRLLRAQARARSGDTAETTVMWYGGGQEKLPDKAFEIVSRPYFMWVAVDESPRDGLLNVFLTRDYVPRDMDSEVTMAVVVARENVLSTGNIDVATVLTRQIGRLTGFADEMEMKGYSDELRKRMNAWAQCVCNFDTRCQGGRRSCKGCSVCEDMPSFMGMGAAARGDMAHGTMGHDETRMSAISEDGGTPMAAMSMICPPKNVCLVVDVSGSMGSDGKLELVKHAVKESLRHYMKGDWFSLITFADTPEVRIEPTRIPETLQGIMTTKQSVEQFIKGKEHTSAGRTLQEFVSRINELEADGGTDILEALRLADLTIRKPAQSGLLRNRKAINRMLLFSDGRHDDKRADKETLAQFRDLTKRIVDNPANGISISSFGVGKTGFDEVLLSELVKPSLGHSGRYYYVRNVKAVYGLIWSDLMILPLAKDTKIYVDLADGIEASALGTLFYRDTRNYRKLIGNLKTFSEEAKRTSTVVLRVSAGTPGDADKKIRLATVTLEYVDMNGNVCSEEQQVYVRISSQTNMTSTKASLIAKEEIIIQKTRDALAKALTCDKPKAIRILREQIEHFRRME